MQHKFCQRHHNEPAVAHCRQCQRPLCADCAVRLDDHIFCSEECVARFEHFKSRWKEERPSRFKWVWKAALLAAAAVLFLLSVKIGAGRDVPFFVRLNEKIFGR